MESAFPTKYWHVLDSERVQCDVCPRRCQLREGQRGLCFIRKNDDASIVLTTFGRSSGFCIDPVEKKPLNHFLPGTAILSFGTAGCNLTCSFCQNWDISKSREDNRLSASATPEIIASAAHENGCSSVAFTYNDPVIFFEYAMDVADACRVLGMKSVAVTAGYMCAEPRTEFFQHIDAANVDLKAFTERFYKNVCGGKLGAVKETLAYLVHETSVHVEITTLLIPGENDSNKELDTMTQWIASALGPEVPLHFTAFHPDWHMRTISPTPASTLTQARARALRNGLRYVYTGNLRDPVGGSTYCHVCGALLIGRDGYVVTTWSLTETGSCTACGTQCHGVFAPQPGTWGARRLPLHFGKR